jgi:23S rRNA-intervening sequence protein
LRSGTSVGANIREAQNSESQADFIHKLKIAAKEADETEYWLELCKKTENYPNPGELLIQIVSIKKLLNAIISTMKNKQKNHIITSSHQLIKLIITSTNHHINTSSHQHIITST